MKHTDALFGALACALTGMLPIDSAFAGCTENSEARVVGKSIRQAMRCDYKALRSGPDPSCSVAAPPACAGSLVGDANDLAYGLEPLAEVDTRALRDQLKCQKRIGKALQHYVRLKLRDLIKGKTPAEAEAKAIKHLDKLADDCAVTVAEDAATHLASSHRRPAVRARRSAPVRLAGEHDGAARLPAPAR